jgi:hypothetical protein
MQSGITIGGCVGSIKIVIGLPPAFWALPDVSPVGRDFSKTGTGDPADSDVFLD